MNPQQVQSLLRDGVKIVGVMLVAKGIGDAASWEAIGGGAVAAVPIIWALFVHTKANTVKTAATIVNIPADQQRSVGLTGTTVPK